MAAQSNLLPQGVATDDTPHQTFNFDHLPVRTVNRDGEIWFVAADVCAALAHTNPRMAVSRLDDDEKGVSNVYTHGGSQEVMIVSESGLYSLILTSRKEEAKRFKRWITHEVLPAIRKTGGYQKFEAAPALDVTDAPSMKVMREVADDYLNAYYEAIKAGKTRHHIDGVQTEVLQAILAHALMSQRMLVSFNSIGQMNCRLIPGDASVVSFAKDDYFDIAQHVPMERLPDMLDALNKRVACHLGAFSERLRRDSSRKLA